MPATFQDTIDLLVPELQRRGIFWNDFHVPSGTYRENLFEMAGQHEPLDSHPAGRLIWRAPKNDHRLNGTNGSSHSVNGHANGVCSEDEEALDPMSMQIS